MKAFVLILGLLSAPAFADCTVQSEATGAVDFNTFNGAQQGCNSLIQSININRNECSIVNAGNKKRLKLKRVRRAQDSGSQNASSAILQDLLDNTVLGLDTFLAQLGGQVAQKLSVALTTAGDCSVL